MFKTLRYALFSLLLYACASVPQREANYDRWHAVIASRGTRSPLCYAGTFPAESEGSFKTLHIPRTEKPYLIVTERDKDVFEISASIGAPFLRGSKVELVVDNAIYSLFYKNSVAWARDRAQERAILASLPQARDIQLRGVGENGTTSIDHYSSAGLGASLAHMQEHCT